MAGQYDGLLQQFGLPEESESEILARNVRNGRIRSAKLFDAARYPSEYRDVAAAASNIGTLFGQFMTRKQARENPEAARARVVEDARTRFEEVAQQPGFSDMSLQDKATRFQEILAESAFQNGVPEVGATVGNAVRQQKREQQAQEIELDKLRDQRTAAGLTLAQAQRDAKRDIVFGDTLAAQEVAKGKVAVRKAANGRGTMKDVYIGNSQEPMAAFIDDDFNVIGPDGEPLEYGTYSFSKPPAASDEVAMADAPVDTKAKTLRRIMSPSQQGAIRDSAVALERQARASNEIFGILRDLYATTDGQPINIMDGAGTAIAASRKIVDTVGALSREFGGVFNVGIGNPDEDEKRMAFNPKKPDVEAIENRFGSLDTYIPSAFRDSGRSAAEMKSVIVTLAYAKARANEPGNTRLSDTDFKNALQEVGASVSDPETMRRIFRRNIVDGRKAFEMQLSTVPDWGRDLVVPQKTRDLLQAELDSFDEITEMKYFGTAAQPSEDFESIPETEDSKNRREKRAEMRNPQPAGLTEEQKAQTSAELDRLGF